MATSLSLENDPSLAQGYIKVNGTTAATITTSGITGNLTGNVTGSLTQGGSLTLATAQTASGTAVDFTGIPSWAKRITVMFDGVSTNGNSNWTLQLGTSSGFETTGYLGSCEYVEDNAGGTTFSTSFLTTVSWLSTYVCSGMVILNKLAGNTWVENGNISTGSTSMAISSGSKTLSGTLTQIRLSSATPDTFDAGTINISFEG